MGPPAGADGPSPTVGEPRGIRGQEDQRHAVNTGDQSAFRGFEKFSDGRLGFRLPLPTPVEQSQRAKTGGPSRRVKFDIPPLLIPQIPAN